MPEVFSICYEASKFRTAKHTDDNRFLREDAASVPDAVVLLSLILFAIFWKRSLFKIVVLAHPQHATSAPLELNWEVKQLQAFLGGCRSRGISPKPPSRSP